MGKTIAEGRKVGSGRPKGVKNKPKNGPRPKITFETIRLDNNQYWGKQLKPLRLMLDLTMSEIAQMGNMDLTNVGHFENGTAGYKNCTTILPVNMAKYLKALGVKEVIIKL